MRLNLLVLTFISSSFALDCPEEWELYEAGNVCTKLFFGNKSWDAAEDKCKEEGGHLVIIQDLEKNAFVLDNNRNKGFPIWIGLRWNESKWKYQFINKSLLETSEKGFPPWKGVAQEDDIQENDESSLDAPMFPCVYINAGTIGWGTANCSSGSSFACEKPLVDSAGKSISVYDPCGPDWRYYSTENSCIKLFNNTKVWDDARFTCLNEKSDLARVFTKDKKIFLSELAMKDFWIGAVNSHQEGKTSMRSIYHDTSALSNCPLVTGMRVGASSCHRERAFFCEIYPIKKEPARTHCSYDHCICKKKNWSYFNERNVFVTINWAAHNFTSSNWICQNLGGRLMTIADEGTARFVRDLKARTEHDTIPFWIGLAYNETNHLEWKDGTPWRENSFQRWAERSSEKTGCVSVLSDHEASWKAMSCESELYSFCESPEPCVTHLTTHIDGNLVHGATGVMFRSDRNVSVHCSIVGYPHLVTTLTAFCGQDSDYYVHGRVSVTMMIPVTPALHNRFCGCKIKFDNGTSNRDTVKIIFLARPRLVDKGNWTYNYEVTKDHSLSYHFEIFSNPAPKSVLLVGDEGSELRKDQYKIAVVQGEQKAKYRINVILRDQIVDDNQTDVSYEMTIDNGIEKPLIITFIVEADAFQSIVGEAVELTEGALQWSLLLNILGACSLIVIVLACYVKPVELERIKDDEQDQRLYPEKSMADSNSSTMEENTRPSPDRTRGESGVSSRVDVDEGDDDDDTPTTTTTITSTTPRF